MRHSCVPLPRLARRGCDRLLRPGDRRRRLDGVPEAAQAPCEGGLLPHEMRVDLTDYEGNATWAKYGLFHLGDASTKYRLQVGRYNGTAGDGFGGGRHNGHPFTTHDNDNDAADANCAARYRGAWWYDKCHISNLNGFSYEGEHETYADGIEWQPWRGYRYSLKTAAMMIRPAF
ncbi:FreD [Penaeus vannamei]|uniref:FreD n=1 Tax=Penaeus vannamei TaxID=6689 RepID=A0A423TMP3_PENVA|nr:FreD [Penaeus vannamei]